MNIRYIDNAASTKVRQEVLAAMEDCNEYYGNPSSIHSMGQKSKELIDNARNQIAKAIDAKPNEIIFTSGGTESNNLAIQGFVRANGDKNHHIITASIEHASVLNPLKDLQYEGYDVTYLPVDSEGKIDLQQLQNAIRRNTILISIMFANNEIGTIQPIKEIGRIAKQYSICFHTDAVQAFGHCEINVNELNINMMSISGHKIYAPKGVGALYLRNNIELLPILRGGGQEYGLRSGTENANSIIGLGKAAELLDATEGNYTALKNKLVSGIMESIPDVKYNGPIDGGLPNIVNLSFKDIEGETLLMLLDSRGVCVSTGSACLLGNLKSSRVLNAIGVADDLARGSLRFSFGRYNTEDDVDYVLEVLPTLVENLRKEAL